MIGAGIIGLSIASKLSLSGLEVIVIDKEKSTLQHASSHNSEVIHSGIYYPKNSLKSELCIQGNELLYEFCDKNQIDYQRVGKLIFINDISSMNDLENLLRNGTENGLKEIRLLNKGELIKMEPNLTAHSALFIESTGLIDSHAYGMVHEAIIENNNGYIILDCPFLNGEKHNSGWKISVGGQSDCNIETDLLINSAGYESIEISEKLGIEQPYTSIYIKGHYYKYSAANPFNHLIYPIPEKGGLGIHTSSDVSGVLRFGPDAEISNNTDYLFDDTVHRRAKFSDSIKKYFKDFDPSLLTPDYTGIRIRTHVDHNKSDFIIQSPKEHDADGLINLIGIESPGLTASLAIANRVKNILL